MRSLALGLGALLVASLAVVSAAETDPGENAGFEAFRPGPQRLPGSLADALAAEEPLLPHQAGVSSSLPVARAVPGPAHRGVPACDQGGVVPTQGCHGWVHRYDSGMDADRPWAVRLGPDEATVYVAGHVADTRHGPGDAFVRAVDAETGATEWSMTWDGYDPGGFDGFWDMAVAPDGESLYVTGPSVNLTEDVTTPFDGVVFRVDADTGAITWDARIETRNETDWPRHLVLGPDGDRVVVGAWHDTPSKETYPDWFVAAYDAGTGEEVWRSTDPGGSRVWNLEMGPDGDRVYATGGGHHDRFTKAYDLATGGVVWEDTWGGAATQWANAVDVHPDGDTVYVGGFHGMVRAYNASTGDRLWLADAGPRSSGVPRTGWDASILDMDVAPDGETVLATGAGSVYRGSLQNVNWFTKAIEPGSGEVRWARMYDGPAHTRAHGLDAVHGYVTLDVAFSLEPGPEGERVYVGGWSSVGPRDDDQFVVLGRNVSSGERVFEAAYNGPVAGEDEVRHPGLLAVTGDGESVFAGGRSDGVPNGVDGVFDGVRNRDVVLLRYDVGDEAGHGP